MRPLACVIAVFTIVIAYSADAEGASDVVPSFVAGQQFNDNAYLLAKGSLGFVPAIAIGEEYDDNVFLTASNTVSDYITHIVPSINAAYMAPLWDWKIAYSYDYRYYAHKSFEDDHPQKLDLLSTTRVVKDLLYFDVRDNYGRTSLTTVQDFTQQSLVQNLTDYNTLELNPYAALQLTSSLTLTAGYQYRNIWYKDPRAVDQVVNSAYGDLARSVGGRTSLTAVARYDGTETSLSTQHRMTLLVGAKYEFLEGSHLWGSIGAIRTSSSGSTTGTQPAWEAGLVYTRPTMTVSAETGRTFVEDPLLINRREDRYLAALRVGTERTNGGVSVGLRNYSQEEDIDERRYSTAVDFTHFLTENMQGKYALSIDRYERYPPDSQDTMTIVYITDVRLEYHASESTTVSLVYIYTNSYSPNVYTDNYKVNRGLIAFRKVF